MSQKFKKSKPKNVNRPNHNNDALKNISAGASVRKINKLIQEIKSRVERLPSPVTIKDKDEIASIDKIIQQIPDGLKSDIAEQIKIIDHAKADLKKQTAKTDQKPKDKKRAKAKQKGKDGKEGKTYRFQFYMTPSMHKKLEKIVYERKKKSKGGRITVASIINEALEKYVADLEKS